MNVLREVSAWEVFGSMPTTNMEDKLALETSFSIPTPTRIRQLIDNLTTPEEWVDFREPETSLWITRWDELQLDS